jgi:hypothetical protein
MTLFELHVDLSRVANALEKIAHLLEKLVILPLPADVKVTQATLDDLHIVTPEDVERMSAEAQRFAEIHRVVPGSEAFTRELLDWEAEQKELNGETWKAPDWAEIFASARR